MLMPGRIRGFGGGEGEISREEGGREGGSKEGERRRMRKAGACQSGVEEDEDGSLQESDGRF